MKYQCRCMRDNLVQLSGETTLGELWHGNTHPLVAATEVKIFSLAPVYLENSY